MAVDLGDHVLVNEPVANRGDVAERHDRAVGLGDERNILEILADAPLGDGLQDHAAGVRPYLAHGEVEGRRSHLPGHFVDGKAVAAELLFTELYRDLAVPGAFQPYLRD